MSEPLAAQPQPLPCEHCTFCGAEHLERGWPRTCGSCQRVSYRNPIPVAVVLQPIRDAAGLGLLVVRRGIEPQRGHLALPGGYVDWAERWEVAAARELREETQLEIEAETVRAFDVSSPPDGRTVLIFGLAPELLAADLPEFVPTSETTQRVVIRGPQALAFPMHTAAVEAFFAAAR